MTGVLDASAVLALLNDEPGSDVVRARLDGSVMSLVNAVEVGTKLVDRGLSEEQTRETLELLDIPMIVLDAELADRSVALRATTRSRGLSLADRVCVALAAREGLPAITADRNWSGLDLPCEIVLIR